MEPVDVVPDSGGGSKDKWMPHLKPLMDDPNVWHKVARFDSLSQSGPKAAYLRKSITARLGGIWEFVARGVEVYGRFCGMTPALDKLRSNGVAKKKRAAKKKQR